MGREAPLHPDHLMPAEAGATRAVLMAIAPSSSKFLPPRPGLLIPKRCYTTNNCGEFAGFQFSIQKRKI